MPLPLAGVRVLDLTNVIAGPLASYQLAMLGAEIIKVEAPGVGDLGRKFGADPALGKKGMGVSYCAINPGLVYCAISGFGQAGPLAQRPTYVQIIQGYCGLMSLTGNASTAPTRAGYVVCSGCGCVRRRRCTVARSTPRSTR